METNRLEAFSDGVFAIAITLLILEIKVPTFDSALGPALLALWPSYLAYILSFVVIGAIWINHHAMFQHIERTDGTLLLLNVLNLMVVAFLPFPTAVLAEAFHHGKGEPVAAAFYGAVLTVLGLLVNAIWWHAVREPNLMSSDLTSAEIKHKSRMFLVGPAIYAIATGVALIAPWLALGCFLMINLFYLWPRQKRASAPSSQDN